MYDQSLFLDTLSGFAETLVGPYDLEGVLAELTERVTAVLGLVGSGVTVVIDGELQFVTALPSAVVELEQAQHNLHTGPCLDAFHSGEPVTAADLRTETARWPGYVDLALEVGVLAGAGIPLKLAGEAVGALNLYAGEVRNWSDEDVAAARVLADMATVYLVNASKLAQQTQLSAQLQYALDHRIVIEQAKGIVASSRGTTVDAAFEVIRRHARNHNTSIAAVADAIVNVGLRL